jgi:formyl-CoA transferase
VELLNASGVPCGPIYRMDEVFADPQVKHLGAAARVRHPRLGEIGVLAQPIRLSRTPAAVKSATPEPGQHTQEILAELGYSAPEIAKMREGGVV